MPRFVTVENLVLGINQECNFYPLDTFPEILIGGPRNNDRRSPKYPLVFPELSM